MASFSFGSDDLEIDDYKKIPWGMRSLRQNKND